MKKHKINFNVIEKEMRMEEKNGKRIKENMTRNREENLKKNTDKLHKN